MLLVKLSDEQMEEVYDELSEEPLKCVVYGQMREVGRGHREALDIIINHKNSKKGA